MSAEPVQTQPENISLAKVLKISGSLTVERTLEIAKDICTVLILDHKQGIVHGKLRPSDVLLIEDSTNGEHVKIQSASQEPDGSASQSDDLRAFGALLYEMLTGFSRFGPDADRTPTLPPNVVSTPLGRSLGNVVERLISNDSTQWYQTAEELLFDLQRCSPDSVFVPRDMDMKSDKQRFWYGLAITLIFSIGSIALWNLVVDFVRQSTTQPTSPIKTAVNGSQADIPEPTEASPDARGAAVLAQAQSVQNQGDLAAAAKLYENAIIRLKKEKADPATLGKAFQLTGDLYRQGREFDQARKCYEQSLVYFKAASEANSISQVERALSEIK